MAVACRYCLPPILPFSGKLTPFYECHPLTPSTDAPLQRQVTAGHRRGAHRPSATGVLDELFLDIDCVEIFCQL
ncbi:unnamed protein product [Tenebrio molitor]|nr:unnamed protein product [Tenebrio molitor]